MSREWGRVEFGAEWPSDKPRRSDFRDCHRHREHRGILVLPILSDTGPLSSGST